MKNLRLLILAITLLIGFASCDEKDASNSYQDKELTCGSSLSSPFQCISASGKSTLTTYQIPELYGCWDSKDFDFCVKYNADGTGLITFKPSAFVSGSTQKIKWGAMVNSKGELLVSNMGTIYIAHESLQGSLDPQIALLSFKKSTKQWYGFDLVSVGSCGTVSGGGGTSNTGNIIFWTQTDHGCGPITVTINNQSGSINSYYGAAPACGANGGANFTLPAGNYSYTAKCAKYQWGSSITITAGGCIKMKLN
jgi:hypothetical protein